MGWDTSVLNRERETVTSLKGAKHARGKRKEWGDNEMTHNVKAAGIVPIRGKRGT